MVESSTRVERTLRLDAPLAEAWEMLLDVPRWGMLFPHVDTIDDDPTVDPPRYL